MKATDSHRGMLAFGLLWLALLAAAALSLCLGSQPISPAALLRALLQRDSSDAVYRILLYVRLPRTAAALLAGCALSLSGTLIQSVLRNPMASPNVIGVNAGAGFAALLVSVLAPGAAGFSGAAAFAGALITALFIYALSARAGLSRTTLILAGVAVSSILNAGINAVTLFFPEASICATGFMLGGFSGVTLASITAALPYLIAGALLAALLRTDLNLLQLGDETAASLGLNMRRVRLVSIGAAALLAGAAVSFAGLLSFVGLLCPHIARRLVGHDNRALMPAATLLGGVFVLACDIFARTAFAPFEIPVGVVMSLLGGPFFLYLLLRGEGRKSA